MKKKIVTLPTLVGLTLLLVGLVSGVWLIGGRRSKWGVLATAGEIPKEIEITNLTDEGFAVSWITEKEVSGFVEYGERDKETDLVAADERDQEAGRVGSYQTHWITVRGLKPESTYLFKIGSGGAVYDQDGEPYTVATGKAAGEIPEADVAYGRVLKSDGKPAEGGIVYLKLGEESGLRSALIKSSGSWVIPLSQTRNVETGEVIVYDKEKERVEIEIVGGGNKSHVITNTAGDSPVPDVVLGEDYNFLEPEKDQLSKFSNDEEITLLSPADSEEIKNLRPEVVGTAPAGTVITVEVNSPKIIKGQIVADANGKYVFNLPSDLTQGTHTITVTADINGVIQKIVRSFVVLAQEEETASPEFSASPSATLIPQITATSTPAASSPTVKPSPTILPTILPTRIPTSTAEPEAVDSLPDSGWVGGTISMLVAGGSLLLLGGWWYRRAVLS